MKNVHFLKNSVIHSVFIVPCSPCHVPFLSIFVHHLVVSFEILDFLVFYWEACIEKVI